MKAVFCSHYGEPEALQIKEIAKPVPGEKEVLVKIHATAINDYDWSMVRGKPYLYRLMFGFLKPKYPVPGMELAGTVEAIGPGATNFKPGDAVYGDISEYGFGSFAEYICVDENALAPKPAGMSYHEAAAIPHAALLAVQGLIDAGRIKNGQNILINGAGGGMGTFGLQLARLYKAEVTGVDTGEKLQRMKVLGFDHLIDYMKEDFTRGHKRYDLILDAKTNRPPRAYQRVLAPKGKYVTVGGSLIRLFQLFAAKLMGKKNLHIVSLKANKDLAMINKLYVEGKIKPVIDGPYPLEDVPGLIRYFGQGRHLGKVVISVS